MNDAESLVGAGQYTVAASSAFTTVGAPCASSEEQWYAAALWYDTEPTTGDGVTFGSGMDTAAIVAAPQYQKGFLSIARGDIAVGVPTASNPATMVSFYGQVPPGLSLAVSSDTDSNLNVKVWRTPRRIKG